MELGATMELLGKGRSTLGKKTSLYSGGNNPTVTPKAAPQRAVLPLQGAVLPLVLTVLPQMVAVLLLASGTKKYIRAYHRKTWDKFLVRSGTTAVGAAVVLLWSGSKKLHPLQFVVVPLQPFQNTKTAITFANGLRIR